MALDIKETFLAVLPGEGHVLGLIHEGKVVDKLTVIGFALMRFALDPVETSEWSFGVYPITPDGVYGRGSMEQDYVLIRPDGLIDLPFDSTFKSIAEAEDYLSKEHVFRKPDPPSPDTTAQDHVEGRG